MPHIPPHTGPVSWLARLIRAGIGEEGEDIHGDLHELYQEKVDQAGVWRANIDYCLNLLSLVRLFRPLRLVPAPTLISRTMLSHYFKIAFRNLLKHRSVTLINLLGLAVGLASCLLILSYVRHERSYDAFHEKGADIYRVTYQIDMEDFHEHMVVTPNIISPISQREFPEVLSGVRVFASSTVMRREEKVYQEDGFIYADSTFFDIFSYQVQAGDLAQALRQPKSLVISQSTAQKYFGTANPIGQSLMLGSQETPYAVTAVISDVPANSHLKFDAIASYTSLGSWAQREQFGSANYYTYLLLQAGSSPQQVEQKIAHIVQRDAPDFASGIAFHLQSLRDIHLKSTHLSSGPAGSGDISYVYLFSAIGLLILLIACINYMNLATARSVDRAKEVGLRKVVGARYGHLFWQFMGEAMIISLTALVFAILIVHLALPWFQQLSHREISITYFDEMGWGWLMAGIGILVALMAGSYPAVVFARLRPISVLRGTYKSSNAGIWLRKGLVVFQFSISIVLIIATLVVQQQLNFISDKKLGYNKEHLVVLPLDSKMVAKLDGLKGALQNHHQVLAATACTESPHMIEGGYNLMPGWEEGASDKLVTAMAIDADFVKTMDLKLIAGADFTHRTGEVPDEQYEFHLNEHAVELMGWTPEEAIGKRINLNGRKGFIKGVVNDFHTASLHQEIGPVVLFSEVTYRNLLVRIAPNEVATSLAHIGSVWQEWAVHRPFEYNFLDEQFNQLYREEQQVGNVFGIFASLAILIACLGLFGLASFTTHQRAKEIGIRKVLGASVPGLVALLSREFVQLVVISILLAGPIAWLMMNRWLEAFSYKVDVSVGILILAGFASLVVAWLPLSYQAIRTAMSNPANVLKDE